MFKNAVKDANYYIRPIISGKVLYHNKRLINSIYTMIVLNKNGDILTTASNANLFLMAEDINETMNPIIEEINNTPTKRIKKIEEKYAIKDDTIIQMKNILINLTKDTKGLDIIKHPYLDMAIIKVKNSKEILIKKFPTIKNTIPDQGETVCNIGFAFPEFDAFEYNNENNQIINTNKIMNFPSFPMPSMVTRNAIDKKDNLTLFELSEEVLPGQSGGPVIDKQGNIIGMLLATKIITNNKDYKLKLGIAVNSKTIIEFLNENNIEFSQN